MFYFYPRSPCGERLCLYRFSLIALPISIHALLAESDKRAEIHANTQQEFLSTLSLRRATSVGSIINNVIDDFYPRSPCGERRQHSEPNSGRIRFLSTLSMRRATTWARGSRVTYVISIHALLAESDRGRHIINTRTKNFYPRSPCGERQQTAYFF